LEYAVIVRQGIVFVGVGGILVCIDWAVFVIMSAFGVPTALANICGRLAGALLGFFLNGSFTFRSSQGARLGRHRLLRFALAWAVLTVVSTTVVVGTAAGVGLHYAWAVKPMVEALMAFVSFVVCRQWVYR
jgi:putative flippase GtrA